MHNAAILSHLAILLQAACAAKAEIDYLVTRDRTGFAKADVPVASPAELLALVSGSAD